VGGNSSADYPPDLQVASLKDYQSLLKIFSIF
jgi:hypothetical protein